MAGVVGVCAQRRRCLARSLIRAVAHRIAAIVVAHNSAQVLRECVDRLLVAAGLDELIVVDNGSSDGCCNMLPADPRLTILRNRDNPGFSVACNQGARAANAALLAFINPDCFVTQYTLTELASHLESVPTLGMIGADVRDASNVGEPAARRSDPTLSRAIRHAFGDRAALHVPASPSTALSEVDAISGALMMIRRDVFDRVHGFDEGFRLHAEDLDLCRRVRAAGMRVAVAESTTVVHLKGTSSQRQPWFVAFHKHRGLARYWMRWGAGGGRLHTAIAILAVWLRFLSLAPGLLVQSATRAVRS